VTAKSLVEHVVDARHLAAPPTVGIYFASPNGAVTVLLVTRIARVARGGSTAAYRLYCLRLRRATLLPDITVIPGPESVPLAGHEAVPLRPRPRRSAHAGRSWCRRRSSLKRLRPFTAAKDTSVIFGGSTLPGS
jgi:hypothetical protein